MAVFTPTITGLTSLTTENINIDNNSITALNSSLEQVSYTSVTTNIFTNSQTFNTGDWQALNATVAVNNTTAPDGTTTADKITQNSGSTNVDLSNLRDVGLTSNSGTDYTISIHAKISANRNFLVINEHISSDAFRKTWFNLSNGTVGTNYSSHTATITDEGNGWYRCSITVTSTVTNTDSIIMFGPAETDGAYIITDNQGSMFFWGAQLEESATLTGYLTTTSASLSGLTGVTRGVSGTTAATASSGGTITLGSASTTLSVNITATQDYIPLASLTGVAASGTASIGTSNMDLNLSASGTGSVTINQIKTNSVTGEVIPGKLEGTNFTNSLLIGHSTTGTLSSAGQNVGVGLESLEDITSGDYNTAAGYQAGKSNTTATGNTFIGALSGVNTTSTGASVGVGYRTLWGNYGIGNSAIGYYASRFNGNGTGNVSIGRESLEGVSGTSHSYNTALGAYSNTAITTGGYNVTLGYESGDNITTGSGNIIIGSVDAGSATGDRQLKIAGYDGTTTTTWLTGDSSGNLVTTGDVTLANDKKVLLGATTDYITAVASSNQVGIYSGQHINLHPTAGGVYLSKTGSVVGSFNVYDEHFTITNHKINKDMIFKGVNPSNAMIAVLTLDMSDEGTAIFNHDILPTTDATQDLGSTSKRWNNIYTGDLHLSNESTKSGNSIDGTKGNWTLQEGQSDLFLINNNTGKKYKFKIEEIE